MDNPCRPLDYADADSVRDAAQRMAATACRQMDLRPAESAPHWEDMLQEAIVTLYEYAGEPVDLAMASARYSVVAYICVHIFRYNVGDSAGYSKQYAPRLTVEDIEHHGRQAGHRGAIDEKLFVDRAGLRYSPPRPTEEMLIRDEEPAGPTMDELERGYLYWLVGTATRVDVEKLTRDSRVLALSSTGGSPAAIGEEMGLNTSTVWSILGWRRPQIEAFLGLPALLQGLILGQGEIQTIHPDTAGRHKLNQRSSYIAVLPHGSFRISIMNGRNRPARAQVFHSYMEGDRCRRMSQTVGNVGQITYQDLHRATAQLQQRVNDLYLGEGAR